MCQLLTHIERYEMGCRLKQLGLSTAGNKKTLQERLALHMDSTACAKHSAPSAAADPLAGRSIAGPSSKVPAGKGVFKAQKRNNFVRINLKVSCPPGEDITRP